MISSLFNNNNFYKPKKLIKAERGRKKLKMEKKGWKILALVFIILFVLAVFVILLYMTRVSISEFNLEKCIEERKDCGAWCFDFSYKNCVAYFCKEQGYNCSNITQNLEVSDFCIDILEKYA